MIFNIILEATNLREAGDIAESIHESLAGSPDYIDSKIILNIDDPKKLILYMEIDEFTDLRYIDDKVKKAVKCFMSEVAYKQFFKEENPYGNE